MARPRRADPEAAESVLSHAQARVVDARVDFEARVRELEGGLHDPRRAREAGRLLDEIARGKRYKLAGHRTFDDFVRDTLGISRPTAHRLRTLARAPESLAIPKRGKTAAYEAARSLAREAQEPTKPAKSARTKTSPAKAEGAEKTTVTPARARSRKRPI
ncbi:MAG: hypothetical protein J0L92_23630 [Deltaproteobacteria bacterium]|nr:hypothetical protein [Deltaproteobacteria bacterium]